MFCELSSDGPELSDVQVNIDLELSSAAGAKNLPTCPELRVLFVPYPAERRKHA
jgi:hypothetical protein